MRGGGGGGERWEEEGGEEGGNCGGGGERGGGVDWGAGEGCEGSFKSNLTLFCRAFLTSNVTRLRRRMKREEGEEGGEWVLSQETELVV